MQHSKTVVITGANRGIGLGLSQYFIEQGYELAMVGRNKQAIDKAVQSLNSNHAHAFTCDLQQQDQIQSLCKQLQSTFSHLNILINNAGIFPGPQIGQADPLSQQSAQANIETEQHFIEAFQINALATYWLSHGLLPLLKKANHANIVNISSRMGQLASMHSGHEAYRVSKTALNAITTILAKDFQAHDIKVNCLSPGWVKTDMGGKHADRSIADAIPGIVWAAELAKDGPTGQFFADGKNIVW